jgi:hypothetical protein
MTEKKGLLSLATEKIDKYFSIGKYGDFTIVIMNKNGYVNATKLCRFAKNKNNKPKEFKNWLRNNRSSELVDEIAKELTDQVPFISITQTMNNEVRGTYVHPDLIPHIASWASPAFAIKVSRIANNFFNEEKDRIIEEKTCKINKLNNKIDKLDNKIERVLESNRELIEKNKEILYKVDRISNNRVIGTGNDYDISMFVLIKNYDIYEYDENKIIYDYHVLRVMKKSYETRIRQHYAFHVNMKVILKIYYSPNSANLWHRVKMALKNRLPNLQGCKFNLENNYTQTMLINDIKQIHAERFDTERY